MTYPGYKREKAAATLRLHGDLGTPGPTQSAMAYMKGKDYQGPPINVTQWKELLKKTKRE